MSSALAAILHFATTSAYSFTILRPHLRPGSTGEVNMPSSQLTMAWLNSGSIRTIV